MKTEVGVPGLEVRRMLRIAARIVRKDGPWVFLRGALRYGLPMLWEKTGRGRLLRMRRSGGGAIDEPRVPEGYLVRTFLPGDEAAWVRIMDRVFGCEYRFWEHQIDERAGSPGFDPGSVFFATCEGRPVGTACGSIANSRGVRIGSVQMVGVLAEHRGKGLGRALVLHALRYLEKEGVAEARLDTQRDRVQAIAMYRRLGFEPVDTTPPPRAAPAAQPPRPRPAPDVDTSAG